jgi:hypothetical protein
MIANLPPLFRGTSSPFSSTILGTTPKNGSVAEPGLVGTTPGSIKAANYSAEQLAQETATYDQFAKTTGASDMTNLGDIFDEASKKE